MYDTIRIIPSNTCFPDSSDLQFLIYQFRIFLYSSIFKSLPSKIKLLMSIGKHIRTQIIVSGSKEFIFVVIPFSQPPQSPENGTAHSAK